VDRTVRHAFREARSEFEAGRAVRLGEFGPIYLPYEKMGAIDSIDLFGLDELLIFAYYRRNSARYRNAADIGANIGLHSIVMGKCGWKVEAYEPDPAHHSKLLANLERNGIQTCTAHRTAISDHRGKMQFVRVLGNTTSSHLAGAKANPYGELERFDVDVDDIRSVAANVDLLKVDAEGHEAVILKALPIAAWKRLDAFVEIGSEPNARDVFNHFADSGVNIFAQKRGWRRAATLDDLPTSYREGGVFLTTQSAMPW
jgi:FkbM family methyltransferase